MNALERQRYLEETLRTERYADKKRLLRYGAKAYSQNDEDGIIAEIFRRISTVNCAFVEIGIGNGLENNTLALLLSGWHGVWIDGHEPSISSARDHMEHLTRSGQLQIEHSFVTRENVNDLLSNASPHPEPDLLSIDVDGNDYHIWNAVQSIKPRVVVMEYNATWFPPMSLTITYQENFQWQNNNYFGASLKALESLGRRKGYSLVGCCFAGVNAFFVRSELCRGRFRQPFTAENHYEPPRYGIFHAMGHPPGLGLLDRVD